METQFKRDIHFEPGFASGNYGVRGVKMRWLLTGAKGVVQFLVFTNWYPSAVQKELTEECHKNGQCYLLPMPRDLGYHSPTPMYDTQDTISESCKYLGGKPCYYDEPELNAEPIFAKLVNEGHEAVWSALEEHYHRVFDKENTE